MANISRMGLCVMALFVSGCIDSKPEIDTIRWFGIDMGGLLLRGPKKARVDGEFVTTVEILAEEIRTRSPDMGRDKVDFLTGGSYTFVILRDDELLRRGAGGWGSGSTHGGAKFHVYHKGDVVKIRWKVREYFSDARPGDILKMRIELNSWEYSSNVISLQFTK